MKVADYQKVSHKFELIINQAHIVNLKARNDIVGTKLLRFDVQNNSRASNLSSLYYINLFCIVLRKTLVHNMIKRKL